MIFSYCAWCYSSSAVVQTTFTAFDSDFSDSRNADSFQHLVSALILAETQWMVSGLTRGISVLRWTRNPAESTITSSVDLTGRPLISLSTMLSTSSINSRSAGWPTARSPVISMITKRGRHGLLITLFPTSNPTQRSSKLSRRRAVINR